MLTSLTSSQSSFIKAEMAILSNVPSKESEIWKHLQVLETQIANLNNEINSIAIENAMQNLKQEALTELIMNNSSNTDEHQLAWKERLIFRYPEIHSNEVWRGQVIPVYDKIVKQLAFEIDGNNENKIYFGATYNPERKLDEHGRTLGLFAETNEHNNRERKRFVVGNEHVNMDRHMSKMKSLFVEKRQLLRMYIFYHKTRF
jgi:hypothetical protein